MTKFSISISDPTQLAGITAARNAYNAGLPLAEDQSVEDHPDYIATDAAYVSFVMTRAAASYAVQYGG